MQSRMGKLKDSIAATKPTSPRVPKPKEGEGGVLPWFSDSAPLSNVEQSGYKAILVQALSHLWPILDDLMEYTNPRHLRPDIWSSMDHEETLALANFLIKRGSVSPAAAQAVRGIVKVWNEFQWGIILMPRLRDSFLFYLRNGIGLGLPVVESRRVPAQ